MKSLIVPPGGGPATRVRESGGTVLSVGAITDGQFLKRDGSSIVSAAISGGGPSNDLLFFGDGSDGIVSISSGTTTLLRPMFYSTLTISGTGRLNPAGHPVVCAVECDLSNAPAGAISTTVGDGGTPAGTGGGSAGTSTSGLQLPSGEGGAAGGSGGTTTGTQGSSASASTGSMGGIGGAGGAGGAGASGGSVAGRSAPTAPNSVYGPRVLRGPLEGWMRGGTNLWAGIEGAPGTGGSGDTSAAGGGGGGSGSGGWMLGLWAKTIRRSASTAAGAVRALGGTGGSGAAAVGGNRGGGGGAGGGGGGVVYVVAGELAGSTATNALDASGGNGGNGGAGTGTGTAGTGGGGGNGGIIAFFNLGAGTLTLLDARSSSGAAASGATGGAGYTAQMNL